MPFVFRKSAPASIQVAVSLQSLGQNLNLECRPLGVHALGEWADRALAKSDVSGISEILVGWDVEDQSGIAVPLTSASLAELLDSGADISTEIVRAYLDANRQARRGN
ncbi:MAG: hypothetical protein E6R11_00095 [Rhodocyclaceae bacterium]|nr:MAG: hypothetical protein E6R11_00095 [Rhodocyclaceae bacterium]